MTRAVIGEGQLYLESGDTTTTIINRGSIVAACLGAEAE